MIGEFRFYRPRRLLPFSAAYALVFINGATLVPFVPPGPIWSSGSGCSAEAANPRPSGDSGRWMQYERGIG